MIKYLLPLFCCLSAALPAAAQDDSEVTPDEYQRIMSMAMKNGSGSQMPGGQGWDARLKVVSGTVMVRPAGEEDWIKVSGEVPLEDGDSVKAAGDGVAEVLFDDKGVVSLNRNTELEISSKEQENTVLSLAFGSVVAKLKRFLNDKQKFQVHTPAAVCAVRGTEFAVEYSQMSKEAGFGVFDEGRVAVTQADEAGATGQEYVLEKNNEIFFNPAQKRYRVIPLSRMGRHRGILSNARKRLAALKGWKPRAAARRAQLRDAALKRKVYRKDLDGGGAAKKKVKANLKKRAAVKARAKRQGAPGGR